MTTLVATCCVETDSRVLTFSGSVVGREADVLRRQFDRFHQANPAVSVALRATPDAAGQRHQLYIQWLNARAEDPDVLQLDVVWTPEFAAAGWIVISIAFHPSVDRFFDAAVAATAGTAACMRSRGLSTRGCCTGGPTWCRAPRAISTSWKQLARRAQKEHDVPFGLVWQGARYEGLVTVFLEYLGAFGGASSTQRARRRRLRCGGERALTYDARRD